MLLFIGSLVGTELSPSPNLATMPIVALILGTATLTIPAALINQKLGRKGAGYLGIAIALASAVIAAFAINYSSFGLFVLSAALTGAGSAFFQQFRFAAIESLENPKLAGPALSLLMLFTLVGAFIGPELGTLGYKLIPELADYTGSYLILAILILISALVFSLFKNPTITHEEKEQESSTIATIIKRPTFIVALLSAALGYAVMSFLMTSTPLSMHHHHGYSLEDSKWVIQSHMIAMFLPSLFSGYLVKRFGSIKLMIAGCILYFIVVIIALSGQHLLHYWWALVVLGVGWNFLFLSGTTMLPSAYHHNERFKAQAVNDFSVFGLQALASLSAAWVLINFGWETQVLICLPLTLVVLVAAVYHQRKEQHSALTPLNN